MATSQPSLLLQFPDILLEMILGYLSYNEIANLRIVCHKFNEVCPTLLNRGFRAVEHYHLKCQKEVKSQLPRRESERRDHPLAHHCNILSGIETRLSLLNMTFLKYVDAKLCCFIPGKVIDEIYRVLRFVQSTKKLFIECKASLEAKNSVLKELRANVILKELRDISSMAMEHFEEKILPAFKTTPSTTPLISFYSSSPPHFSHSMPSFISLSPGMSKSNGATTTPSEAPSSAMSTEQITHMGNLKLFSKQNKSHINTLKKQLTGMQNKLNEASRKISEQEQVILELNRVLSEQTSKLSDHENKFVDMNRKMMENDQRLSALLNMMNCTTGVSYSTSGYTYYGDAKPLTTNSSTTCSTSTSSTPSRDATNVGASTSGLQRLPSQLNQAYQSTAFFLTPGVVQPTILPISVDASQQNCIASPLTPAGVHPTVSALYTPPVVLPQPSPMDQAEEEPSMKETAPPHDNLYEPQSSPRGKRKRRSPFDATANFDAKEHRCKKQR